MTEYVVCYFAWDQRGVVFSLLPLLKDFQALCPSYKSTVAKEATKYYELSELPQVKGAAADFELTEMVQAMFYAMLLNEAIELGVVRYFMAEGLKSALVDLRWSSFEVWMSRIDDEVKEAQLWQQAFAMEIRGSLDGQEEGSGSHVPPPPSSDEEYPEFYFEVPLVSLPFFP
ncbi:hypothetical protein Cgig2_007642 [Carnegiea gigantea]|uniref:Uncharacterized protein n=1 Tax=Carnegiea gigantea TaxID=171969 RepID=A0A9Q1Q8M0_9CARY|nr:hypothetical protein Cgig2_007642 [Carnegiea gigantea]